MKSKNNLSFFPPEERLAKIRDKMLEPNYPRINMALPKNATPLEKSKYSLCKKILTYQQENNLPIETVAQQINLTVPEVEDILFARLNKFTLDRLNFYLTYLFPDVEHEIFREYQTIPHIFSFYLLPMLFISSISCKADRS